MMRRSNSEERRIINNFVKSKSIAIDTLDFSSDISTFHVSRLDKEKYVCKGSLFPSLDEVTKFIETSYHCDDFIMIVRQADENTKSYWLNKEKELVCE
jgi:hypothetical protein